MKLQVKLLRKYNDYGNASHIGTGRRGRGNGTWEGPAGGHQSRQGSGILPVRQPAGARPETGGGKRWPIGQSTGLDSQQSQIQAITVQPQNTK